MSDVEVTYAERTARVDTARVLAALAGVLAATCYRTAAASPRTSAS